MTEKKIVRGIVLNSCDYKEKDKLCQIFTVELGKITAVIKNCKSTSAKLKFASQPLCFAEFSLVTLGKFYQVVDAKLIDSFFDVTKQLTTYYISYLMLELVDVSVQQEEQNAGLFITLINALKHVCYDNLPVYFVALKFCESILDNLGYKLEFKKCSSCNLPFTNKVFFNVDTCEFVCNSCKSSESLMISNQAFACAKIVENTEFSRLSTIKIPQDVAKEAVVILCKGVERKQFKMIRSLKFI